MGSSLHTGVPTVGVGRLRALLFKRNHLVGLGGLAGGWSWLAGYRTGWSWLAGWLVTEQDRGGLRGAENRLGLAGWLEEM